LNNIFRSWYVFIFYIDWHALYTCVFYWHLFSCFLDNIEIIVKCRTDISMFYIVSCFKFFDSNYELEENTVLLLFSMKYGVFWNGLANFRTCITVPLFCCIDCSSVPFFLEPCGVLCFTSFSTVRVYYTENRAEYYENVTFVNFLGRYIFSFSYSENKILQNGLNFLWLGIWLFSIVNKNCCGWNSVKK